MHRAGGRFVGDEASAKFGAEMSRHGRMTRDDLQDAIQFFLAKPFTLFFAEVERNRRNFLPENFLVSAIVTLELEFDLADFEIRLLILGTNRPTREAARHFHDILLRVAAMDAEGVEFQQFACVILVGLFRHVLPPVDAPVEVPKHRRTESGGAEHFGEFAEGVFANHLAVVRHFEPFAVAFGRINVEVVRPKLDHHLV